ncbi:MULTISPECIES: hypothetical protein [Streptomyces]|uniref:hypothetical protein n=1 Tax=Streptomyces TaxID=1883 RepID=UPI0020C0963A|nr:MULTISPECIES: hypothetical protein [Streptomyces]MCL6299849.1 hypothetical protein [Streptomyces kronopolitis]GLW18819.1 lipoprotein [Streptomyces sp. NBRC 13847]
MSLPRSRPAPGRIRVLPPVLGTAVAVLLLAGCTGTGEPKSAGHTASASAPARLWPERSPAPQPPSDEVGSPERSARLSGVPRVPSGDIRKVPLLTVVEAQLRAGSELKGTPEFDRATTRKIEHCATDRKHCPVRTPQYRDLNNDGKDELLVGIESPDHNLALWVFMLKNGALTRIMDAGVTPLAVEVTGGDVIVREPTGTPGFDVRTVYSWDKRTQSMTLRVTEYDETYRTTPRKSTS